MLPPVRGDDLKNTQYTWRLRIFCTSCGRTATLLVRLHAEPGEASGEGALPQTLSGADARQRQELSTIRCYGMMGGYIEEGFPFYFINRQMLRYLGYESEADFVADIGGLVANCMHPDDRGMVDEQVEAQLAEKGEYVVEYRMKKKDGSYIWVHDAGRRTVAEDGRPAIASVCVDITAQREAQEEVLRLYNNIPGAVFRCRSDADFTVIEANDGLFEFIGYTREEFAAMGNRMSAVIHPDDFAPSAALLRQLAGDTIQLGTSSAGAPGGSPSRSSSGKGEEQYFIVFDVNDERRLRTGPGAHEEELAYFSELASREGSIQGTINVSRDRLESYQATLDVAVAHVGDTYVKTIQNLSGSAVDAAYGVEIRRMLARGKVLEDYAAGKVDYRLSFLRRRNDGSLFWGSTNLRTCLNPATGDVIMFFYTADVTEQRLQEQLLNRIAELDYDVIADIDLNGGGYRVAACGGKRPLSIPAQGDFREEAQKSAERCMDEAERAEFLQKLDFGYIRRRLAGQDAYTFVLELREAGE
ncbi:MAG: PAS domain-containing protein, partial [Anaerotruncus massiliensis (ex Togo et al. 2019)]